MLKQLPTSVALENNLPGGYFNKSYIMDRKLHNVIQNKYILSDLSFRAHQLIYALKRYLIWQPDFGLDGQENRTK